MPQPGLHLLLARRTLDRWGRNAPFDARNPTTLNAFLHGSLAVDMGSFPGGSRALARTMHTHRTGDVVRSLLHNAATGAERAFAYGWLTHVIADALIHPLVDAAVARRVTRGAELVEHVRVEVGIDVWFCWQHPVLAGVRLHPAFDRTSYRFLADALNAVLPRPVTTAQLTRMERGLIVFSHGALHFATEVARHIWWRDAVAQVPLGSTMLWHTASLLSPRNSVVNAYLTPHVPRAQLIDHVENAIAEFGPMLDRFLDDRAQSLPNYDLEDGSIPLEGGRQVA